MLAAVAALALTATLSAAAPAAAQRSPCGDRTAIRFEEDAQAVARRCGVNVEKLRDLNPGLELNRPQAGTFVITPAPSLPRSRPADQGNRAISSGGPARYRR